MSDVYVYGVYGVYAERVEGPEPGEEPVEPDVPEEPGEEPESEPKPEEPKADSSHKVESSMENLNVGGLDAETKEQLEKVKAENPNAQQ